MGSAKGNKLVQTWDSAIRVDDWNKYIVGSFKKEKDLCNYIDDNAQLFARDILEINYLNHVKEWSLGEQYLIHKYGNTPRIDFLFTSKESKNILVECKNPTNIYSEVIIGISQLMAYYCQCKKRCIKIDRLCLVTSKFDPIIADMVKEFTLPIEIFVFSKDSAMKVMLN